MDPTEQAAVFNEVIGAAAKERCLVAPVGSAYFLFDGVPRAATKDVDAVVHARDLEPVSIDVLRRIAAHLGDAEVTEDGAVLRVRVKRGASFVDVELIRGRSKTKGGFVPRALLREAAASAERRGHVLIYDLAYILVLKADAAVDREQRAEGDPVRAEEHRARARAFQADVFGEVNRAMLAQGLDAPKLDSAIGHLKKKRRVAVRRMLVAAGAPLGPA